MKYVLLLQHNTIVSPSVIGIEAATVNAQLQRISYNPEFARANIWKPVEVSGYD